MTKRPASPGGDSSKIRTSAASDQRRDALAAAPGDEPGFRIARDGTWFHENSPIARKALVKLFSSVLRREADGQYWLVTPIERARVEVEDAPFTAVELSVTGSESDPVLRFRTNLDDWIVAGPAHPIRVEIAAGTGEPRPYIAVRDGLEALILRAVYYQLAERAVGGPGDRAATLGVWSNKTFFPLAGPV